MDLRRTKAIGVAAFGLASVLVACGKTDANRPATAAASGASVGGSGVSAAGTAAGDSAGVGGAMLAPRCAVDLDASCRDFELGSPHVLLLRPDEYRNSIATLFGAAVDVEAKLTTAFGPYEVNTRADIGTLGQPGYA